jgi:predicted ATPase
MPDAIERESMEFDIAVVGRGPAGLAAACRLMQLSQEAGEELSVVVLEIGSEIGAHILSGNVFEPRGLEELDILGRGIRTERCAKGVAWFDFEDICDGPRSQQDYIEIARWYPTVIVSNIPVLTADQENQARRFVALVDEFYDRKVKLMVSAAAKIETLYAGPKLTFEFQRTTSRLIEMQSTAYLHAPHLS